MAVIYYCIKNGHECFEDYIDSLGIIDKKVYYKHDNELSQYSFDNQNDIYIFRYHLPLFLVNNPRVYVLNTEQMSDTERFNHVKDIITKNVKIIDYSLANVRILKDRFPKATIFYLPYQYQQTEIERLKNFSINPTGVGIINCKSTHRRHILQMLKKSGIKATHIRGWKDIRDKQIGNCKILLNIHHDTQFKVFEHIRCDRWIFSGKTVVSEPVLNVDLLDIKDYVIFTNNIITTIKKVLASQDNLQVPIDKSIIVARKQYLIDFCIFAKITVC